MPDVSMYCTQTCPYCNRAEMLLNKKGTQVRKIFVDNNPDKMTSMIEITGRRTVPQIFIGELHVGGFDDLAELDSEGKLDSLLQ
ncbi:glutaredoxin 3 [Candidatus Halobeggiatoa sp. HSG11]|nr:glutaredoxin 3 [Candidatus Halobeggiatoa sp. HSG11]